MLLKSLFVLTLHCTCGYAMRLSDKIYITTPPSSDEQDSSELIAPEASSLTQYYQEQNIPQTDFFQQQQPDNLSPFLYSFMIVGPRSQKQDSTQKKTKNTEQNSRNQEENSYKLYRPDYDENPHFVDMLPPPEAQDEPNYYGLKKRKSKKYSAADDKQKKYLKIKEAVKSNDATDRQDLSDRATESPEASDEQPQAQASNYETFEIYTEPTPDSETNRQGRDVKPSEVSSEESESDESVETSAPSSRLDFQMHGHKGPRTYKFGYDTGKGKNRQFKVEEKDEHGNVVGQYGYHDDEGKFRIVKYSAMKNAGFKVL